MSGRRKPAAQTQAKGKSAMKASGPANGDIRSFFKAPPIASPCSTGKARPSVETEPKDALVVDTRRDGSENDPLLRVGLELQGEVEHSRNLDRIYDKVQDNEEIGSPTEVDADDFDDSDDEYISVDEEDADKDAENEDEDVLGDDDSPRPAKRMRPETAEQWIRDYNEQYPVSEDDADLKRFQSKFRELLGRLHDFSCDNKGGTLKDWKKIPRDQRAMTKGFMRIVSSIRPDDLAQKIMDHMPRKVQQILGQESLSPLDLLGLPRVPECVRHRFTYADIPVRVGTENICQKPSKLCTFSRNTVKTLKSGVVIDPLMEAAVYAGSASRKSGGYHRLVDHEKGSNKRSTNEAHSLHYQFSAQADVVANFRLFGLWTNPYVISHGQTPEQDTERWMPCFLEGMIMVYLGLYDRRHRSFGDKYKGLFTDQSYNLVAALREDLQLPNMAGRSLNRAWSLMQGQRGGMITATRCANEGCRAPFVGKSPARPYYFGTRQLRSIDGGLSLRYCFDCYDFARKNDGQLRSREGRANGYFAREAFADDVNATWFADGNPRMCYNTECGVTIPDHADIFGFMKGIRCQRCFNHSRKHKTEWNPNGIVVENAKCEKCDSDDATHRHGGKLHCHECNIIQCCFSNEADAKNTTRISKVIRSCANPGCQSPIIENMTFLVEDIQKHEWRCLPCDWSISTLGVEIPKGLDRVPRPADEAFREPIPHHRFNDTKCVDCGRYATFSKWTLAENGYKCGLCDHKPCAGIDCQTPLALMTTMRPGNKPDEFFCVPCYGASQRRSRKDRRDNPRGAQKRSDDWVCGNAVCPYATAKWKGDWGYIDRRLNDPSARRCSSCFRYWKQNGKDRIKFKLEAGRVDRSGGRQCQNCPEFEAPGGKGSGWGYHGGKFLCRRCWNFYDRHKEHFDPSNPDKFSRKMPESRKCSNCGRRKEDLAKSEAFHFEEGHPKDEDHVRCTRCWRHFTSPMNENGLDWPEKDW